MIIHPPDPPELAPVADLTRERELRILRTRIAAQDAELELLRQIRGRGSIATAAMSAHAKASCKYHLHILVDDEAPQVACAECGTSLDPMTVLRAYAHTERQFNYATDECKKEQSALRKEIEILKRQKQQLRSAIRKLGAAPVERWDKQKIQQIEATDLHEKADPTP